MHHRPRLAATVLAATTAALATPSVGLATSDAGDADGSAFSVLAALREMPPVAIGDTGYWITVGDIGAAVTAAGATRADSLEMDALIPWLGPVTGLPLPDTDPPQFAPVFLPLPEVLSPSYASMMADTAAAVGWSINDVSWYSSFEAPPNSFTVLHGEFVDTALADLPTVASTDAGDVMTLGEGDDHAFAPDNRNALSAIGTPVRMALVGDTMAVTRSTPAVTAWLDGYATTAADNPALAAIAAALDEAGVHSATIGTTMLFNPVGALGPSTDAAGIEELLDEFGDALMPANTTHVGIGWGDDDGAAVITLAYFVLGDDEDVAATAAAVEAALADGSVSVLRGQPIAELLTLDSVTTGEGIVVATVRPAEGRPPAIAFNMWISADIPFLVY